MLVFPLRSGLLLTVLALLFAASTAKAHPLLDEARRHMDAAEFEAAVDVLGQVDATEGLSRESLVELFEIRAMASHALRKRRAMHNDMQRLCALAPRHDLARVFPPEMHAAYKKACRGRSKALSLIASALPVSGGVQIDVDVRHSAPGLVREVLLWARTDGSDEYSVAKGDPARVRAPSGATVEYFAQALGPGGTVVAQLGTPSRPRRVNLPSVPSAVERPAPRRTPAITPRTPSRSVSRSALVRVRRPQKKKKSSRGVWWVVGGTTLALAAASGVAAAFLLDDRPDASTRLSSPTLGSPAP